MELTRSRSTESSSASSRPNNAPLLYSRARTLGRGGEARRYRPEDFRWIWAAYNMGAFSEYGLFRDGASIGDLREAMEVLTQYGLWFIVAARHQETGDIIPMCLIAGTYVRQEWPSEDGITPPRIRQVYEPHTAWFPWATARNRIECGVRFFNTVRREMCCEVYAPPSEREYYTRMCQYGVMRRVGRVMDYFGFDREPADLWQTRRAKS